MDYNYNDAGYKYTEDLNKQHAEMVKKLVKPGKIILSEMTPQDVDLMHHTFGICGEAGELLDAIKKVIVYKKPIDRENIMEELGDIEFYLRGIRQVLSITRGECLEANINKLAKRYPNFEYTNQRAVDRADKNE